MLNYPILDLSLAIPTIEKLSGPTNGFNVVFETSRGYIPGSTKVFRNGLLGLEELTNGWSELGDKKIKFKEPPQDGEVFQIYYLPR